MTEPCPPATSGTEAGARVPAHGARVALALGTLLAAGCVTVTPAERQQLSRPEMTPATDAREEVWHTHIEAAREAGFGGHGAAGGGCGCG